MSVFYFCALNEVEQFREPCLVEHFPKHLAHVPYCDMLTLWLGLKKLIIRFSHILISAPFYSDMSCKSRHHQDVIDVIIHMGQLHLPIKRANDGTHGRLENTEA